MINLLFHSGEFVDALPMLTPLLQRTDVTETDSVVCRQVSIETWDRTLGQFEDASVEQSGAWLARRWGAARTICLTVEDSHSLLGGAAAAVLAVPFLGIGIAFVKFGPVWRHSQNVSESAYTQVLLAVRNELSARGLAMIVLPRPTPDFVELESRALLQCGFRSSPVTDPVRYVVNVRLDPEAQEMSLQKRWRHTLRQALRTDLKCEMTEDVDDFAAFSRLFDDLVARKRFSSVEAADGLGQWLASIPDHFERRLFVASRDGQMVAGAFVVFCGDTCFYLYAASNEAGLQLNASYALQWRVLDYLRSRNISWYDLGGAAGSSGLRLFKKGFAGKRGCAVEWPGQFMFAPSLPTRLVAHAILAAQRLRARMQGG